MPYETVGQFGRNGVALSELAHLVYQVSHPKVDGSKWKDQGRNDRVRETNEEDQEGLGIDGSQADDGRRIELGEI